MKRVVVTALAASAIALLVFACDDGFDSYGDGYGYGGPVSGECERHASCGTCTPVVGCGWCYASDGQGTCTSSPDHCTGSSFGWTWEPSGCRVTAEAGVSGDGGRVIDGEAPEGSPTDSAPSPASDASDTDSSAATDAQATGDDAASN